MTNAELGRRLTRVEDKLDRLYWWIVTILVGLAILTLAAPRIGEFLGTGS